ncbi:MAG TPA: DUF4190 domain-containing protein [Streptomyces sp.]
MTEPDSVKRDSLALPSLITGLLGFLGVTALLGLVFGIIALVRTKSIGQSGRGMAIGGIVASTVWIIALPLVSALLLITALRASNTPIALLQIDNCYNTARPGVDAVRVPCDGHHDGVVTDAYTMPQPAYPGERVAKAEAQRGCEDRLATMYGGQAAELPPGLEIVGYAPDEAAWVAGSPVAVCGLEPRSGTLFGPLPH